MPLTRAKAIGYDADLMMFKFMMRNGAQIVQCQISNAALSNLAGRWRCGERDLPAEFETHRELIEAIASAQFAQTPMETTLVRIFAKQCRPRSADVETPIKTPIPNPHSVNKQDDPDHHPTFAVRTRHLPPIRLDSKKG